MSRRQALGILTNQTNQVQQRQALITKQVTQKEITNTTTFFSAFQQQKTVVNDENELQNVFNRLNKNSNQNFDFEIFQDDLNNKENPCSVNNVKQINNNKQSCDDNDFQIYTETESCFANQSKQQQQQQKKALQAITLNLLDTSNDSPMVLDDTIKFQTKSDITDEDLITSVNDEEDEDERLKKLESIERENILMNCEEYAKDIIEHLKELELINRPKATYIKQQQDITSSMRSILVDWLVEVCEEYKLHTETLYLAVNYTDRFLSKMSVLRGKLQLLGTAAIYIASKYEEIFPPDVAEFVYITDDTYTKQQVLRMEHLILKVLNFHMNSPTANCFLLHFLRFTNASRKIEHLSRYLAELTLVEAEPFLEYTPSQIATSALYLAMYTLRKEWKSDNMQELTGYKLSDIKQCIYDLWSKAWLNASTHAQQAIQDKYRNERFDSVSSIEPPKSLNF